MGETQSFSILILQNRYQTRHLRGLYGNIYYPVPHGLLSAKLLPYLLMSLYN